MKEIQLTQGKVALVDDEDYESLSKHKWTYVTTYAVRHVWSTGKVVWMHREIICPPDELEVDHINGNRLDNRRENLRACTTDENRRNAKIRSDNTSGFKGVCWNERRKHWIAQIRVYEKRIYLGSFKRPEEAHAAYCTAALKYHGEFANFGGTHD